ncbi:MAG: helix-hairpin-helix domain-containing protein [Cetobacterium sp.]
MKFLMMFLFSFTLLFTQENFPVIKSRNMKTQRTLKIDINSASKEEMLSKGIALSYVKKIEDYKEKTGGFENLRELKLIKGIGEKTFEKLSKSFEIKIPAEKKPLYINDANEELLRYYGFTPKEIKKIQDYIKKNGKVKSNLELTDILGGDRYEKYKKLIKYNRF